MIEPVPYLVGGPCVAGNVIVAGAVGASKWRLYPPWVEAFRRLEGR